MKHTRRLIALPSGHRAAEGALFVAQLDDQSRRLRDDTRGLDARALEWQPAPGTNTIGMLLAHLAIVEVVWVLVGIEGRDEPDTRPVLGIGSDDDGMPLAPDGVPPQPLRGRDLAFFDDLLERARTHTARVVSALEPAAFERERTITGKDGSTFTTHPRWVLYHVLEHLAGHYGQINLLRHLYPRSHPGA